MAIINQQNVDERYSATLEPNLYYESLFIPGVTCTDQYTTGPGGGIYVHKLKTSAVEPGKPGRDFTDEESADELIQIALNNNFQKSRKIYGVQAAQVGIALGDANMRAATKECGEGRQLAALACLIQEASVSKDTTAITDPKAAAVATRQELVSKKAQGIDVVMCSPAFYALVLLAAGKDFTPTRNERIASTAAVGMWLGMTFMECPMLAEASAKYYDHTGTLKTVKFDEIDYVMYNHNALSVIDSFSAARLRDAENFIGSKAQVELNVGYRVTNNVLAMVRKHAGE